MVPESLENALIRYEGALTAHEEALQAGEHADLDQPDMLRTRSFECLQHELLDVLQQLDAGRVDFPGETAAECKRRLQQTLSRVLETLRQMQEKRDQLGHKLKHMRLGKTALNGYGRSKQNVAGRFLGGFG